MRTWSGYGLKTLRTSMEHSQSYVAEILQQMEAVRYLDGIGCRFPDGISVLAAAVSAYDLYAGMSREPSSEGVGAAIGKEIHRSVMLEVHQDGAPASPASEGEIVHAQDPGRRCLAEIEGTDVLEQGVAGDHHSEFAKQS